MKTISSVESFTGGAFAKAITDKPGASKFFLGSLVTYSNSAKEKLGVDTSNGVYNKETALAMASKGKKYFDSDICVAFTGVAGPDIYQGIEPGTVWIAINDEVFELKFEGTRDSVRTKAVNFALDKIKNTY